MLTITPRGRMLSVAAAAVAACLALAGCATSSDDVVGAAEDSLLPAAEGTTVYPLIVETAVGEVTIDERPSRVVMASSWDGDLFAALGVTPVATDEEVSFYPWVTASFAEPVETVWPVGDETYPAETIAATSPDLVVDTLATDPAEVQKIEAVAPVLGAPATGGDASTWRDRLLLLGEVLDLSDRAQQVIDEYDATFEGIRAEHPEFAGASVDYVAFYGSEYGAGLLNTGGSDAEAFFTNLGFAPNPHADDEAFADGISDELWGTLSGDVMLVSDQEADTFDAFFANPLIQNLASVRSGRLVVLDVDGATWSVTRDGQPSGFTGHFGRAFNYGPLAHEELADLLVPLLSDALEQPASS